MDLQDIRLECVRLVMKSDAGHAHQADQIVKEAHTLADFILNGPRCGAAQGPVEPLEFNRIPEVSINFHGESLPGLQSDLAAQEAAYQAEKASA